MFAGLVVIAIGLLLLLEVLIPGFDIDFGIVWPSVLILIGLNMIFKKRGLDLFNALILFIGIWFLGMNLEIIPDSYINVFWPILIILIGVSLILGNSKVRRVNKKINSYAESNYYGVFSGCEEKVKTNDFKGTNIYAIFGAVDLDLRDVNIKAEEVAINVYSVFGGADIYVPDGYNIIMNSTAVFGSNDNKTKNAFVAGKKTIYVNCVSVFGGTEVK